MITVDDFKSAFRLHPAGVALITANSGGERVALTASSVSAVSASPPLVMFSVSEASSSIDVLRSADSVVVHLLSAENRGLAVLGATSGINRFADRERWVELDTGEPLFYDSMAWLRLQTVDRIAAGEAIVFVGLVLNSSVKADAQASEGLVYRDKAWHHVGSESAVQSRSLVSSKAN